MTTLVAPAGARVLASGIDLRPRLRLRPLRFAVLAATGVATALLCMWLHDRELWVTLRGRTEVSRFYFLLEDLGLAAGGALFLLEPASAVARWAWRLAGRARRLGQIRSTLWEARHAPSLTGLSDGRWVRVRGHVVPGASFTTTGGRSAAVLAWYVGAEGTLHERTSPDVLRGELHGLDFRLALASGEEVRVECAGASFLPELEVAGGGRLGERPLAVRPLGEAGDAAFVYHEEVVAVGDEIEVTGLLFHEVDPGAEGGGRRAPITAVLRRSGDQGVVIRRAGDQVGTPDCTGRPALVQASKPPSSAATRV